MLGVLFAQNIAFLGIKSVQMCIEKARLSKMKKEF